LDDLRRPVGGIAARVSILGLESTTRCCPGPVVGGIGHLEGHGAACIAARRHVRVGPAKLDRLAAVADATKTRRERGRDDRQGRPGYQEKQAKTDRGRHGFGINGQDTSASSRMQHTSF